MEPGIMKCVWKAKYSETQLRCPQLKRFPAKNVTIKNLKILPYDSHTIPSNTFLHEAEKVHKETNFSLMSCIFFYHNLKQFPLSFHSVNPFPTYCVAMMLPVHIGWVHFCKFHTAEWCNHILHGWTTHFTYYFCDTETAVSQYPLLGLSRSSITIVATLVTLLLAMLLLTLFSSIHVWKKCFSSRNANVAA